MLQLLVRELSAHQGDPFQSWFDGKVSKEVVLKLSLAECLLRDKIEYEWDLNPDTGLEDRSLEHCKRVGWLMFNVASWEPIHFEENGLGIPELYDGHHRLCAAILLNLKQVTITYNGVWRGLRDAFPTSYRRGLIRLKGWN